MMTISENQNGSTQEDLAQRVARLEGAMSSRGSRHSWWMGWALVYRHHVGVTDRQKADSAL